ncbi:copper resistance protein NlpE N-terminal domain-containing protein [Soonwooa purpurea]
MINKNALKKLRNISLLSVSIITLSLTSCKSTPKSSFSDEHNAKNSLDYNGIYNGVLPCADCDGIATSVYINKDNTYVLKQNYQGKSTTTILEEGSYSWNNEGNTITLKPKTKNGQTLKFFISENRIFMLDQDGKRITGSLKDHYTLTKNYATIFDKKWKLKEMYGIQFDKSKTTKKEGYISFDDKTKRFTGNAGCNQMNGGFDISADNKIDFMQSMSTMMACENMEAEQSFAKVLKNAKFYELQSNKLFLLDSNKKVIAKFVD